MAHAKDLYMLYAEDLFSYIANELGFSSLSHFNKIFKKETGLPPSRYRKLYLPNMTQYQ